MVNVSSPNTPGLRGLQELDKLAPLLEAVRDAAGGTPVLVKIAPDLSDDEVRAIAALVVRLGLDGIVATNTTLSRDGLRTDPAVVAAAGDGGLSGAPLAPRSLELLRVLRAAVPPGMCIISVGGVETGRRRRASAWRPAPRWCRATRRSCTAGRSGRGRSTVPARQRSARRRTLKSRLCRWFRA